MATVAMNQSDLATAEHVEQIDDLLRRKPPEGSGVLLVGRVAYDRAGAGAHAGPSVEAGRRGPALIMGRQPSWDPLPATLDEIEAIAALSPWPEQTIALKSNQASEDGLRLWMPRCRYIHLATHGFFADAAFRSAFHLDPRRERFRMGGIELAGWKSTVTARNPLILSGVVLAGANRPSREPAAATSRADGILTAEEVAERDLTATELVVLSACETGLGEVAGGEGVLGLQRAFSLAGAHSVIASLWKIEDRATKALMSELYRNLWDRKSPMGKAQALRHAQLRMLGKEASAGPTTPRGVGGFASVATAGHPFFWAAFQLHGDWR
jgi:CHAT domain-containing protein